jgi:anaerobic selenocysteine-containing dehydrogenase
MLLGAIDTPGAFRYKSPYPRHCPPPIKPAGKHEQVVAGKPMAGPPLGFPMGPEDLLVEADGSPRRIDGAYSWEAPIAAHGMLHMVIRNAWAGQPYEIDTLFLYMANMAWNSAMNTAETIEMLTARDPATGDYKIPKIIYADAFASEMVAYADLVDKPVSDGQLLVVAIDVLHVARCRWQLFAKEAAVLAIAIELVRVDWASARGRAVCTSPAGK